MKQLGDGKSSGLYTGLGISYQFANAVLHGLKSHPQAVRRGLEGIEIPIDEKLWQEVFRLEFPNLKPRKYGHTQPLATYCSYYNSGYHGLGYNLDDEFDFGTGRRDKNRQLEGRSVAGLARAVYPGRPSNLAPIEIIRIAKTLWEEFRKTTGRVLGKKNATGVKDESTPRGLEFEVLERTKVLESKGYFDADTIEDERQRALTEVVQRYGQRSFRKRLLAAYGGRCAVTGCNTRWVLEASHIFPFAGAKTDHVQNGLLLRSDVHTLFDLDLIGIEPESFTIHIAAELKGTDHEHLGGKLLSLPVKAQARPAATSLQQRWSRFLEVNAGKHI